MREAPNINHLGQPIGRSVAGWKPCAKPAPTTLSGRFCLLEPLDTEHHTAALYAANTQDTDGQLWTYLPYGPFENETEYRAWIEAAAKTSDTVFFAIIDLQTERAAGVASYLRIEPAAGSIEVGHLAFSPALKQTAAATEATFLLMRHAFALGYRRFEWKCDSLNAPSRAAAERLGFTFEGIFRQATVYKGRNRDTAWYSILDSEWPALEAAFLRWFADDNFDTQGRQKLRLSDLTKRARAD